MFTFMHTYTYESWNGMIKKGLFRQGDGIKMTHSCRLSEEYEFNQIAKSGEHLYELLRELDCPFYIDRLQGGIPLPHWYHFKGELIEQYREMLGDKFWGFQMHEWASNFKSDCDRIKVFFEKMGYRTFTEEERSKVWDIIYNDKLYVQEFDKDVYSGKKLLLEALTPEEWMKHREAKNYKELLEDIKELYTRRSQVMDGLLIPVDSYYMAPRIEIANGAKLLLPEVGWQIPDMRIQMAYTRGMAKAAKIRWGIYYECWGPTEGYGITIPFSLREGLDEWREDQFHKGVGADRTPEERERGGSSRSLQERAWRYAYLSGASVMGEEYGVCNTFRDYHDFELSSYGTIKRDFLRFTERFPDVGETYTPFAIVIPANIAIWEISHNREYLGFPLNEETKCISVIREVMDQFLGHSGRYGNHSHVIKNGGFPDVFDIIHADQTDAIEKYDYLIDLSDDRSFANTHKNIVEIDEINSILDRMLPCRISGDIHTMYNRTRDGWIVLIMNNEGILCDNFAGDCRIPEAVAAVKITMKEGEWKILDGNYVHLPERTGDGYNVTLEAGEWIMAAM